MRGGEIGKGSWEGFEFAVAGFEVGGEEGGVGKVGGVEGGDLLEGA